MTRILAIDVETIPQERYTVTYPPTEEWRESRRGADTNDEAAALFASGVVPHETTGVMPALHPSTAHIVAVNYGWVNGDGQVQTDVRTLKDMSGYADNVPAWEPERALLVELLDRLSGAVEKSTLIVSFNGKGFDLWVAQIRTALLSIKGPGNLRWHRLLYPWDNRDLHCDLRIVLGNDKRPRGTQQWWADAFGIHAEEHGQDVFGWYREGNWDAIRAYGASEGKTLVELFQRVEPVL